MKSIGRVFVDQHTGKCEIVISNNAKDIKDMSLVYIDDKVDQFATPFPACTAEEDAALTILALLCTRMGIDQSLPANERAGKLSEMLTAQAKALTDEQIGEIARQYGQNSIQGFDHILGFARTLFASQPSAQPIAKQESEWIDDPHDIEGGMMRNPKYKPQPSGRKFTPVTDTALISRIEQVRNSVDLIKKVDEVYSDRISALKSNEEQQVNEGMTDAKVRAIAICDGGGYQEMKEDDPEYTDWTFSDEGLQQFARALLNADKVSKRCVYVLIDEAGGVDLKLWIPNGDSEEWMLHRGYVKYVAVKGEE